MELNTNIYSVHIVN